MGGSDETTMTLEPSERLNIADLFLDERVREGRGARTAIRTDSGTSTYAEVQALANRFAHALRQAGVEPENRVILGMPDGPGYVAALFGILKVGGVAVMVNPGLPAAEVAWILDHARARAIVTHAGSAEPFLKSAARSPFEPKVLVSGDDAFERSLEGQSDTFPTFLTHRDDPAIWLFSGGTTGRPKAVVQTHRSFANTARLYGGQVIAYTEDDITLSVPKLYFGYATGSNLFFPFMAGASTALFPEPATAETLFDKIKRHKPTILVHVPTMIHKMLSHPSAASSDLSSLRLVTSAGEALPVEIDERWRRTFGVEILDGLGTAEMWHIFISNRPGESRPGTLGTVVPGFEVRVCDEEGRELPRGETGWLWVKGDSRALGYWHDLDKTVRSFRGEWYVSGDLITMDEEGYVTYCGRGDEMLKVAGKWLAPQEVEGCLLEHPSVAEAVVVGVPDAQGLVKPRAYVVPKGAKDGLEETLKAHVRERLDAYKHPREVVFVDSLPRTHLGKVDRGSLRRR
jgi:benzoate-CoA ligase family protein